MMKKRENMEITFLGTCARDFSPKLMTDYICKFDKNIRRSSSILVNGEVLIDCGPHTLNSLDILKIDHRQIQAVILTHLHSDHCNLENINQLATGRSLPLSVYVSEGAVIGELKNCNVINMKKGEEIGVCGISVVGLWANHDADAYPQHILLQYNGKKVLYATDGGWVRNETYYFLKNAKLDCLIIDCTCGDKVGEFRIAEHNTIAMLKMMLPSFQSFGLIDERTVIYATHIAPSLHKEHDLIEEQLRPVNVLVAYDGLTIR